jgi:hypothetical protein
MSRRLLVCAVAASTVLAAVPARGAEFTEVIDAFDENDPFDLSIVLGYSRTLSMANITRECALQDVDSSDDPARYQYCPQILNNARNQDFITTMDVLRWVEVRHVLDIQLLIGLYRDLHIKFGLPVVVSQTSELDFADGVDVAMAQAMLLDDITGNYLFHAPFKSAERSGVDDLVFGLQWAVFNQERDETKPTWTLFAEGWFSVGKLIRPRGKYKDMDDPGAGWQEAGSGKTGVSDGVHELRVGTRISKRFKYLDPYFGFEAIIPFPKREADWPNMDDYPGQININPPIVGTVQFGSEIIPWEVKAKQQKFYIDLRVILSYHSEGKEMTPLYDALGTSSDPGLTYGLGQGLDCTDPANADYCAFQETFPDYRWTGLTDVENYGVFGARLAVGFITSKWFKIQAGVAFSHKQEHFLTFTDECNSANFVETGSDNNCGWEPGGMGDEESFNPDYRRAVDAVGNRFRIEESTIFEVFVKATTMF